jgi:DNA-binding NarL/FixJ family response regulator
MDIPVASLVGTSSSPAEAILLINNKHPQVVVLDWNLEGGCGLSVLKHIRNKHLNSRVIVLTNHSDQSTRQMTMDAGADYFLDKTHEYDRLSTILIELAESCDSPRSLPSNAE